MLTFEPQPQDKYRYDYITMEHGNSLHPDQSLKDFEENPEDADESQLSRETYGDA